MEFVDSVTDPISRASQNPPKRGLTKVQRGLVTPMVQDNCPSASACKKLGVFKQGACYLGTNDTHKCMVATNLLIAKSISFS
jgi:hypothetical protein